MIPIDLMRETVISGLSEYLGIQIIAGNQAAPAPPYPYGAYNVTTIASANNGTWQRHSDGKDRLMMRSVWSFSFLSTGWSESVSCAIKAREWFEHVGRAWLSDHDITVQSTTDVTNRDNILAVDYERKNGFDVVFYVFNEVENLTETNGYITDVDISHNKT